MLVVRRTINPSPHGYIYLFFEEWRELFVGQALKLLETILEKPRQPKITKK